MPVTHDADYRVGLNTNCQTAAVATGNGTAMPMAGARRASFDVVGITTATITWEATIDGTNYRGVSLMSQAGARAATATADGVYMTPPEVPPMRAIRARISAWTAGTITVIGLAQGA
jgi:hypothetical protein